MEILIKLLASIVVIIGTLELLAFIILGKLTNLQKISLTGYKICKSHNDLLEHRTKPGIIANKSSIVSKWTIGGSGRVLRWTKLHKQIETHYNKLKE